MLLCNQHSAKYFVSKKKVFVKKILIKNIKQVSKNPCQTLHFKKTLKTDLWQLYKPM